MQMQHDGTQPPQPAMPASRPGAEASQLQADGDHDSGGLAKYGLETTEHTSRVLSRCAETPAEIWPGTQLRLAPACFAGQTHTNPCQTAADMAADPPCQASPPSVLDTSSTSAVSLCLP